MGMLIQDYAVPASQGQMPASEFYRGVIMLLAAVVGVAFVSRVAKNFQDYFTSVITQRVGAEIYSDGIQHSLDLPYSVFEDQRSGETLGKLQKVRTDVEKLINLSVNVLFTSLVGVIFVMVYAYAVHWVIAPIYFGTIPVLGLLSFAPEPKDQEGSEGDREGDDGACGIHNGVSAQHRAGEEPRTGEAGNRPPEQHDGEDPRAWS